MPTLEPSIVEVLDRLAPTSQREGDWERVLHDAAPQRRRRRVGSLTRLGLAVAVAAIAAIAATAWPESDRLTILERALAAVGEGPAVHLVLQDEWGGTLVDLETGTRRDVHGERELWFDPERGLREVSRFGGVRQSETFYPAGKIPEFLERTVSGIAGGYREALRGGRARVLGEDVVDGVPVYWLRVQAEMLPDVADGRLHEWAHDVAVSRETYVPVYLRETRDGKPGPDTGARVLAMESLPAGAGSFSVERQPAARETSVFGFGAGRELELGEARKAMAKPALWAGESVGGFRLVSVTELRLQRADAAETRVPCTESMPPLGVEVPRCEGDTVSVTRRIGPWQETTGLTILYAEPDAIALPNPADVVGYSEPHVAIQQAPEPHPALQAGVRGYRPPEGSVLIISGSATLELGGVHVVVRASSEALLLDAVRTLRPIPAP